MADIERSIQAINGTLDREVRKVKRSSFLNILFLIVILVLISGYYLYLSASLQTILKEEEIALVVRQLALDSLPSLKSDMEKKLKESAPFVVSTVLDEAEKVIPKMRAEANDSIREAVPEIIDQIDYVLEAEIRKKASPYRRSIAEMLERLSDEKTAEEEFSDLEIVIEQTFFDEIDHIIDMSYFSLVELNHKIDNVMNVEELTEEQLLEKRFLKMWVNFFKWSYQEK
ncbi:MAG: hypothetical protein JW928_08970 [Candidatus Aureabacteria bacterium]|nr:hypothetical protein [Candidatus Auribacterota bacterium]